MLSLNAQLIWDSTHDDGTISFWMYRELRRDYGSLGYAIHAPKGRNSRPVPTAKIKNDRERQAEWAQDYNNPPQGW